MADRSTDRLDTVIYVCAILTFTIATFFVALRFYTRWRLVKMVGGEDWLILFSLLLSMGSSIGLCLQTSVALGRHIEEVTGEALTQYFRMQWAPALCYNLSLIVTKISILLLYIRVLTYEGYRWVAWVMLAGCTIFGTFIFVYMMITCLPVDKDYLEAYCLPVNVWWSIAGFNVGSDLLLLLFPLPIIISLNVAMRQKMELIVLFTIGSFVAVLSIVRISVLVQIYGTEDFTYHLSAVANWSCIEVNSAIICACLATLKPLWRKVSIKFCCYRNGVEELEDGSDRSDRPLTIGNLRVRPLHNTRESCMSDWPPEPKTTRTDSHGPWLKIDAVDMGTLNAAADTKSPNGQVEEVK